MDTRTSAKYARRYRAYGGSFVTNQIHLRHPWVAAWWSAAFPGLGHMMLGSYLKSFILFFWEFIINIMANINTAIIYCFTGDFQMVEKVLDKQWLLLYMGVYIGSIWDAYRSTVDINKLVILAEREKAPIVPFSLDGLAINYLDKRNPWLAAVWSALMPGLGHLYIQSLVRGFFMILMMIIILYFSHALEAIHYTFIGNFHKAVEVTVPEWLLFIPSLYCFAIYDAYKLTVEYNKLFEIEQAEFLKKNYQSLDFKFPK